MGRNATSYTDIQVFPNTEYDYRVRAYNEAGRSEPSNEVSATTGITPDPPAYLEAAAISTTKVILNWEDNSDNETGFKIERRKAGDKFSQIKTVGKNITTYTDTGLTSNTKYYYRVRAYNNLGNSTKANLNGTISIDFGGLLTYTNYLSSTPVAAQDKEISIYKLAQDNGGTERILLGTAMTDSNGAYDYTVTTTESNTYVAVFAGENSQDLAVSDVVTITVNNSITIQKMPVPMLLK